MPEQRRTRKERVLDVRNTIFEVCDGCTLDEAMQGIIMAQAKIVAATVGGDENAARDVLERYRAIQTEAMPIYCAETFSTAQ